jgi:hypothetical protein
MMYQKAICISIIIVMAIVLLAYCDYARANTCPSIWLDRILSGNRTEEFTSKYDKARVIYDWFKANATPTYIDYRAHMGARSNIVEYEDVLELVRNGGLSIDTIKTIL